MRLRKEARTANRAEILEQTGTESDQTVPESEKVILESEQVVPQSEQVVIPQPTYWPDLVGMDGNDAKEIILGSDPDLEVQIVPFDAMVTADYLPSRVRIFVYTDNTVYAIPKTG
jgi:hypothetical protein